VRDAGRAGAARLETLATLSSALLGAAVALHPLLEPDVFWHLASGRWILEHGALPREDVFSYTTQGVPWANFQWLFDVVLVRAWTWGGADALVLGKTAALALVAALLARAALRAGAGPGAAAAATGLAVLASAERTTERPEIASYLAVAAITLVVERARRGAPRREILLLPVLVAVWINLHSLAFLGPLLLGLHAGAAALSARRPASSVPEPPPGLPRDLALAAVASAVALLANPWGFAAWTFPITLFRRIGVGPDVFDRILEFTSPLAEAGDPILRPFWILVGAVLLVEAARAPGGSLARLVVLAPFLALALTARRNLPLFAIVAAPALAAGLTPLGARWHVPRAVVGVVATLAVLAATIAVVAGASPALLGLPRERGVAVMPGIFPEECLARMDGLGLDARLFNDLDHGGYVAWRSPGRKTFIDGRLEVVGPERLERYIRAHEGSDDWERLRRRWAPEILLLAHSSAGSAAFLRALLESGEWVPVSWTPEAALLASPRVARAATGPPPADPQWGDLLAERYGPEPGGGRALRGIARALDRAVRPDPAPSAVRRAARWANLQLTLGRVAAARAGYEAILEVAPDDPEALFNRGMCALRAGQDGEARRLWTEALPRVDRASRALFREALRELVP
jgi:hypothetical protein